MIRETTDIVKNFEEALKANRRYLPAEKALQILNVVLKRFYSAPTMTRYNRIVRLVKIISEDEKTLEIVKRNAIAAQERSRQVIMNREM